MRWSDVLDRTDIVGGNIQTIEDGLKYCGLISEIVLDDGILHIKMLWTAQLCEGSEWKRVRTTSCHVDTRVASPHEYEDGLIRFRIPSVGDATIYPKNMSIVHASMVEGLASE